MASITDYARMCKAHGLGGCVSSECPLSFRNNRNGVTCDILVRKHPAEASAIIDKWCAEHPQKTYKQDFLEKFPKAKMSRDMANMSRDGIPRVCRTIVYGGDCPIEDDVRCADCWNEVMPDETGND